MRAVVFAVEQIGIDRDRTVTGIQKKQLISQREKVLAGILEHGNSAFIDRPTTVESSELLHGHVHAHVQLGCDLICTWHRIFFTVSMEIAEVVKDSEALGFSFHFQTSFGI